MHDLREGFQQNWHYKTHADAQRGEELFVHHLREVVFVLWGAAAAHSVSHGRDAVHLHPLREGLLQQESPKCAQPLSHGGASVPVLGVPEAFPHGELSEETQTQPQRGETI